MIYPRKIYRKIKKYIRSKQVLVITGMRRVGKTTILKQILSDIKSQNQIYFDLEKLSDRDFFNRRNYDDILPDLEKRGLSTKKKLYIAIDEIQFLPEITSVIKYLYDHYNIKFFVTGSSSYYLKNLFTQSLAGRKIVFDIFPLDFGEFLTFNKVNYKIKNTFSKQFSITEFNRLHNHYETYIKYGGFPEVVLTKKTSLKEELLNDIISSYVNIDIKSLADFRKDKKIYELIKLLAARIGTRLDYNKLASISGISRLTVEDYLDFFEKTYLIQRVRVHTKSPDREIVKAKKVYFCDNGLVNILARNSSGALFENALYNQLQQLYDVRYYALKTGHEIDFVLDQKTALEVKETPTQPDLKKLTRLAKTAGLKKHFLVGRQAVANFDKYIWGGEFK